MVASINSAPGAEYYLDVERSYYYLGDASGGVGQWHGEAAKKFGFEGEIKDDHFKLAFDGRAADGSSLVQRQEGKKRQEAWDMCFSAPKSVSVLWSVLSLADRKKVEELVLRASKAGVDYLESNALITRRGKGGKNWENAQGFYALCPHFTSRAQDQQLHVHALLFNMCLRMDGTQGSIRSHDLYLHKMAAGALFRVELAYLLEKELGLRIVKDDWKFEVEGVPKALCDDASKRRDQILTIANEEGWSSPKIKSLLATATQGSKKDVPLAELIPHWREAARSFGFTEEKAKALLGQSFRKEQSLDKKTESKVKEKSLRDSITKLAKSEAYFPERSIVQHAAVQAQARGVSAREVVDSVKHGVQRFENRVDHEKSDYWQYSTKENVAWEKELIRRAMDGKNSTKHLVTEESVAAAGRKIERDLSKKLGVKVTLSDDQKKALRFITLEPGDLKPVQGYAGTGKTAMLEAAHIAWKDHGYRVLGTALGGKAARGLETATGIRSFTVQSLLNSVNPKLAKSLTAKERAMLFGSAVWQTVKDNWYAEKRASYWQAHPFKAAAKTLAHNAVAIAQGKPKKFEPPKLDSKTILVIDEGAMLGTRAMLQLKKECDKAGAKIVTTFDRLQLSPIEAGGPAWSLAKRIGYESLTTIIRQEKGWMKEALHAVINDEPERALELYAENDSLVIKPHRKSAIDKLVADYRKLNMKELSKSLVLTGTNEEAQDINGRIQGRRKFAGELGRNSVKLKNGERAYKHDRVLFTLNSYTDGVRNGLLGTVVKVEPGLLGKGSVTIKLDEAQNPGIFAKKSQLVKIDLAKYDNLQLGYAVTTHKAQGATVERSFVLMGGTMIDKEMAFTQLSRAKKQTTLYSTELEAGEGLTGLAKSMKKSRQKDLAHDHDLQNQRQKEQQLALEMQRSLSITG